MGLLPHPSYAALNQFSDGELADARQERVASHLADCTQCRTYVAFIRRSGSLARSLETVEAPDHILEAILDRRASGERVLLPRRPAGAPPEKRRAVLPAIAAALTLFAVGVFAFASVLEADRPALQIRPERPEAGQTLRIEYQGGTRFAHEDRLTLRARFRTADGRSWQQIAAILERGDGQVFRAEIPLPDSAVYAAFAVEDIDGENVDSRNRRLWDIMVHGSDGKPTLDALFAAHEDRYSRGLPSAGEMAELAVELYPESPQSWVMQWDIDQRLSALDVRAGLHAQRFRELEMGMSQGASVDPEDMAWLALYAFRLGEHGSADFWMREAERRGAQSRAVYQAKVVQLRLRRHVAPADVLDELETLWTEAAVPLLDIAAAGWRASLAASDWHAAMRWLPRYRDMQGELVAPYVLLRDLAAAFEADEVLEWAGREAVAAGARFRAHRPLHMSAAARSRSLAESRQATAALLAQLAFSAGRGQLSSQLAAEAVEMAWDTDALEALGAVLLAAGDTAGAAAAFARVAADPAGAPPPAAVTRAAGWHDLSEAAREDLVRYVLDQAVVGYLPDRSRLSIDTRETSEMPRGPIVVAFVSGCRDVDAVNALAGRVGHGALTIVNAVGSDDGAAERLRRCGYAVPIRPDPEGQLRAGFGAVGLTDYFIVDGAGRIRFEHTMPEEIPRQLFALEHLSASTTFAD